MSYYDENDDVTMKPRRERGKSGEFLVGDRVIRNRYEIKEILGRGGMGIVYRCLDTTTQLEVALKTIPAELENSKDEMEEIKENFRKVGKLSHPNIAAMRTIEEEAGRTFLVMDFVDGVSLKRWAKAQREKHGSINFDDIAAIAVAVADALDYAHKEGIIHRDIKPGNIMLTWKGEVKLLDFGLAAQIETSLSRVSMMHLDVSGTAPYMAPEQWRGHGQRAATDQYALAVTIYELLAGHPPFENPDKDILRSCVLNELPEALDNVPEAFNAALLKALAKDPKERFENCKAFAEALSIQTDENPFSEKSEEKDCNASAYSKKKSNIGKMTITTVIFLLFLSACGVGLYVYRQNIYTKNTMGKLNADIEKIKDIQAEAERQRLEAEANAKAERQRLEAEANAKAERQRLEAEANAKAERQRLEAEANAKAERLGIKKKIKTVFSGIVRLPGNIKLEMVKIPAGSFIMGSPDYEKYRNPDENQHFVKIDHEYWIGKYEITQAQWKAIMGTNPSYFLEDNCPVEQVSWFDAMDFCKRLNLVLKNLIPSGYYFTLPTEPQWEYACRAKTMTAFCYGNSINSLQANFNGRKPYGTSKICRCREKPIAVGSFKPNAWGIYDMHGNVMEWCLSSCDKRGGIIYPNENGDCRIMRGGGVGSDGRHCRSADRDAYPANEKYNDRGFRVVLVKK